MANFAAFTETNVATHACPIALAKPESRLTSELFQKQVEATTLISAGESDAALRPASIIALMWEDTMRKYLYRASSRLEKEEYAEEKGGGAGVEVKGEGVKEKNN